MKNINLIPTDKPTRLYKQMETLLLDTISDISEEDESINQHIYITSNEEIKEGFNQWYLDRVLNKPYNSGGAQYAEKQDIIILTTDQDLIKEGVQAIDDEFLEWFVNNPSCEEVEVSYEVLNPFQSENKGYLIHCPDNEVLEEPKQEQKQHLIDMIKYDEELGLYEKPKQETLEEAVNKFKKTDVYINEIKQETLEEAIKREYEARKFNSDFPFDPQSFKLGAKWEAKQDKNKYSEEDILNLLNFVNDRLPYSYSRFSPEKELKEWLE